MALLIPPALLFLSFGIVSLLSHAPGAKPAHVKVPSRSKQR